MNWIECVICKVELVDSNCTECANLCDDCYTEVQEEIDKQDERYFDWVKSQ